MKLPVFLTTFLVIVSTLFACPSFADETTILLERIKKSYQPNFQIRTSKSWIQNAQECIDTQKSDGTWPDIDYAAVNSLDFKPKTHLSRTVTLAEAYSTPGQTYYLNKNLVAKISRGLDHWLSKDYRSYNWWNNEIGTQQYLLKILVMTGDSLGKERIQKTLKTVARTELVQSGQNLMWRAEIRFVYGLLSGRFYLSDQSAKTISNLLSFDRYEGMQSDGSFIQHGLQFLNGNFYPLIYNGGYGDKFIQILSKFFVIADGTRYDVEPTRKERFLHFVLDSQLWLTRNNKYDFGVLGRSVAIKNRTAALLGEACLTLSQLKSKEKARFENCAHAILENRPSGLEGNKAFYRSDFAVQQEKNYFASIRMYSTRTVNNDAPSNGEGLMSHHMADGAMMIQKDGTEYENIFGVWNWNLIPGTTTEQKKLTPAQFIPGKPELFDQLRFRGHSKFVGSVSNARYGASTMNFISNPKYDRLAVKKSWFFFKNAIWALGSDLQCGNCLPVVTNLNQTLSKGKVTLFDMNRTRETFEKTETERKNIFAILHRGIGYVFPTAQNVLISNKIKVGDWSKINSSLASELTSEKIFAASINHGPRASNGKYEYLILPSTNADHLAKYDVDQEFAFENNPNFQAVYSKKQMLLQASIFKAGNVHVKGFGFTVSAPCMVMIDLSKTPTVITVSDPTQMLDSVEVNFGNTKYIGDFKRKALAGSSVNAQTSRN